MKTTNQELIDALEIMANEDLLITDTELLALSDLTEEEFTAFSDKWQTVTDSRKQQVVCILHDEADDNTSYDFSRIFKYCLKDANADVRYEAVKSLWESRDTSLIYRLSKMVINDESQDVREASAEALGNFAMMTELEDLPFAQELENVLLSVYYNESEYPNVRTQALLGIAPISSIGVLKAIEEAYKNEDSIFQCAAINAMGRSTNDVWIPVLNDILEKNEDRDLTLEAIHAVGEIGDECFVPSLATILIEKDEELILATINALGLIGTTSAKQTILAVHSDGNEKIQNAIQTAISQINNNADPLSFEIDIPHVHHSDN